MHLNYIDAENELASQDILSELGVLIGIDINSKSWHHVSTEQWNESNRWLAEGGRECSSSARMQYHVLGGAIYLDIRDSGDNWIRCHMSEGEILTLPEGMFHRAIFKNGVPAQYSLSSSDAGAELLPRFRVERDGWQVVERHSYRSLVCELCQQFFIQGWVTGTGGSISIRFGNRIFMTPSGVQKERIQPEDLFVLDNKGNMLAVPSRKHNNTSRPPKLSECAPLFLVCFNQRSAGAALHSHDMNCNLVSVLAGGNEYRIRNQEMIKGIAGYGYRDELVIPIIENTPHEYELTASLKDAVIKYPKSVAVLVRDHGIYVWGNTWEDAKRHGECLHYLFELSIKICHLVKTNLPPMIEASAQGQSGHTRKRPRADMDTTESRELAESSISSSYKHVVFDIEGTTTPITFVKDVLFPFARDNVAEYLRDHWERDAQSDLFALLRQHSEDKNDKEMLCLPTLSAVSLKSEKIEYSAALLQAFTVYVQWNIEKDRKIKALKDLQGKMWKEGYDGGKLRSVVYDDVPAFFERAKAAGKNLCIYSSGSRSAQKLLFKHSNHGDLRSLISCYFDTSVGHKRTPLSYKEIALSLGVDSESEILFVTDIFEEAAAAREAGLGAVISVRPGNASLQPEQIGLFDTVATFDVL